MILIQFLILAEVECFFLSFHRCPVPINIGEKYKHAKNTLPAVCPHENASAWWILRLMYRYLVPINIANILNCKRNCNVKKTLPSLPAAREHEDASVSKLLRRLAGSGKCSNNYEVGLSIFGPQQYCLTTVRNTVYKTARPYENASASKLLSKAGRLWKVQQ